MKITHRDSSLVIVDEVFDEEKFKHFWNYFNSLEYAYRSNTGWQKVWRINDGQILASLPSYNSEAPFKSPMDWIDQIVTNLAGQLEDVIGKKDEDWNEICYTPYIYPVGTKISWHDDFGYTGACIFYPHKEWNPHWGGELNIARTPSKEDIEKLSFDQKSIGDQMTRQHVTPILNFHGMGSYVVPLPNRMVFTSGSLWHGINRVDVAAGDNVRCSIVAFFSKKKEE